MHHKRSLFKDFYFYYLFKRFYLFILEGGKEEKERERNINVWVPLACPLLGTWPATQACALDWESNWLPLVHRLALNPLSHTLCLFSMQSGLFPLEVTHISFESSGDCKQQPANTLVSHFQDQRGWLAM